MVRHGDGDSLLLEGLSLARTDEVASAVAKCVQEGDVILLEGGLGAGKTTFTQALALELGVTEAVVSPTFNIVCIYGEGRIPLNHFDLYRLEDAAQLEDVDFWALVDEDTPGVSVIEWADLFSEEMPDDALTIRISHTSENGDLRDIRITAQGARSNSMLASVAEMLR